MGFTNDEIVKVIKDYIADDRQKQAIMIDGAWGSGKTFFVKEVLMPNISKELSPLKLSTEVLYVSLYGVDNTEKVMNEIYKSLTESMFSVKQALLSSNSSQPPVLNKGKIALKIFSGITSTAMSAIPLEFPELKADDFLSIEKLTIIFDDLERCSIPINETLGFINSLVEHNKVKAIIVGCEAEIREENQISEQDKVNTIETENNTKELSETTTVPDNTTDGKSIAYKNIKEKLIGITIQYEADFSSTYNELTKTSTQSLLFIKYKDKICETFTEMSHLNLRTLMFLIVSVDRIFDSFKNFHCDKKKIKENMEKGIILYLAEACVNLKKEGEIKKPCKNIFIGATPNLSNLSDNIFTSTDSEPIDVFLTTHYLDADKMLDILKRCYDSATQNETKKSASREIRNWVLLDDVCLESCLITLKSELKENSLDFREIKDLIISLLRMEKKGIISELSESLKQQLLDSFETALLNEDLSFIERIKLTHGEATDIVDSYKKFTKPLIDKMLSRKPPYLEEMNEIIISSQEDWGYQLNACYGRNKTKVYSQYGFLDSIDFNCLKTLIEQGSNKSLYYFNGVIQHMYTMSEDMGKDHQLLSDLKHHVDNLTENCTDKITLFNYQELSDMLDIAIQKNKPKEPPQ